MGEQITALWQEAEERLRTFGELAGRTVEAAWLAGDALLRIKEQLPHGAWTPALKERGISKSTARQHNPAYLVSADDLWDREPGEVSTLSRRLLSEEKLHEFSNNVTGEIRGIV